MFRRRRLKPTRVVLTNVLKGRFLSSKADLSRVRIKWGKNWMDIKLTLFFDPWVTYDRDQI